MQGLMRRLGRLYDLHGVILELIETSENEEERDWLNGLALCIYKKIKEMTK